MHATSGEDWLNAALSAVLWTEGIEKTGHIQEREQKMIWAIVRPLTGSIICQILIITFQRE